MFEYFFNVRNKDIAHRQKFVVIGTSVSFLLILGAWIPFQLMQFKSGATKAIAENKIETTSPSPVVAGDAIDTTKENKPSQPDLPFLTGVKNKTEATVSPRATVEPTPTATPDSEIDTPLIIESSPEPVSATPAASDFPTL